MFTRATAKDESIKSDMAIRSLHRYYIHTTLLKKKFEEEAQKGDHIVTSHDDPEMNTVLTGINLGVMPVGTYMEYWYGGLYVVCEGWKDLKLEDSEIDRLLKDKLFDSLKLFRNSVFHFQKDYCSLKKNSFINSERSVDYVRSLSEELGRWFLDWMKENKSKNGESNNRING